MEYDNPIIDYFDLLNAMQNKSIWVNNNEDILNSSNYNNKYRIYPDILNWIVDDREWANGLKKIFKEKFVSSYRKGKNAHSRLHT